MGNNPQNSQVRFDSVYLAFKAIARSHGERIALVGEGGLGRSYTYSALLSEIDSLSAFLSSGDIARSDEIGLLSENRPEWALAYLAILAAGKTVVPLDANLTEQELYTLIKGAELKVLFCSAKFSHLKDQLPDRIQLYCFDDDPVTSWDTLIVSKAPPIQHRPNETAALIFTSGTTGNPKAVMLSHRNLLSNIEGVAEVLPFTFEDTFLSILPLHHTFEATCGFLVPLLTGARIVYARSLKSRDLMNDIATNNVTVMCGVPLLYEKIYHGITRAVDSSGFIRRFLFKFLYGLSAIGARFGKQWGKSLFLRLRVKAGLSSVRIFVSGGAALPPTVGRFFNLIGMQLIQGYGMTECSPIISCNRFDDNRFGSVGPPLPNIEVRIANPQSDGTGEILVRGENVTAGYKGNPEQTSELIQDSWLNTGDLGRIEKGHLWITGRAKNVIISGAGKNIYPEEIEEKLLGHAELLEAVVFGRKKDGRPGEEVRAVIVPDLEVMQISDEGEVTESEMQQIEKSIKEAVNAINTDMASYKRISGYDIQLNELDKTSTKKVKRYLYR